MKKKGLKGKELTLLDKISLNLKHQRTRITNETI